MTRLKATTVGSSPQAQVKPKSISPPPVKPSATHMTFAMSGSANRSRHLTGRDTRRSAHTIHHLPIQSDGAGRRNISQGDRLVSLCACVAAVATCWRSVRVCACVCLCLCWFVFGVLFCCSLAEAAIAISNLQLIQRWREACRILSSMRQIRQRQTVKSKD